MADNVNFDHLLKGEPDWHDKVNANFDKAAEAIGEGGGNAVPKPVDDPLPEGLVYLNADGTTKLSEGGGREPGLFKYTVLVDNGEDGNPAAVEYADDCTGFLEARGSNLGDWANTALVKEYFKPCVIQAGAAAPAYYLQQDNMTKKEDGTNAVLTGADGDVMIEIKKLYGKFTSVGTRLRISIMNFKEDDACFCFNDIAGVEKDVTYRGAYKASVLAGATSVMRSVSGVAPVVSQTRATMRGYARNRGAGYHQNNAFLLFLYEAMFLLLYKHRDGQTVLGQGRTLATNTAAVNTGHTNARPFCWGDTGGVNGMKFLGVEDFWGNIWEWVDGIVSNTNVFKVTRDPAKYDDVGTSFEISQATGLVAADSAKALTKIQGTNDLCFLPKGSGGTTATYWCDNMWYAVAVQVAIFGGDWSNAAAAGPFCWSLNSVASHLGAYVGSRLCRA